MRLRISQYAKDSSLKSAPSLFPEDSNGNDNALDRIQQQLAYIPEKIRGEPVVIYQPSCMQSVPLGFHEFERKDCLVRNCFITTLERHKQDADVVFFSPSSQISLNYKRPLSQLWVLQLLESPENTDSLQQLNHLINYTASYRWDSDIVSPYSMWLPVPANNAERSITSSGPDIAKGKTRKVAWFVSHCITNNMRREYAFKLQNFIQVDIFGGCGELRVGTVEGAALLKKHYKFYLSFENSNCRDYVTEKFFDNALSNNVIPIVMGAPKEFYESIAPPKSFIHVNDFNGPEDLASYLHKIDQDDALFNSYFAWKTMGKMVDTRFWCRLCALVQQPRLKVYEDVDAWWRGAGDCTH